MAINSRSIRELADSLFELDRRLTGIERTPQMGHTSLEDIGLNVYDAEGNRTAVIGKQDDGSFGHRVIEGPTPAAPSGITTEPGTGNFLVSWDGTFAGGVEPPRDFSIVAIHASETPDFIPMPENTVATFSVAEAATRVVPLRTGTYYVSATTLSLAGKRSVPTEEVQAESAPLVDEQSIRDALDQARTEREEAAQEAQEALTELEGKLGELTGDSGELQTIRDAVAAAQQAVASAQTTASEAVTAANAASQAALEAAGIAASKGRVIVQETEPQGEDRKSSNIWIQPVPDDPDTEVEEKAVTYVYLEASDEWQPTTSSELAQAAQNALDAREAAQQAQQRADTAIANAADALTAAQTAKTTADGKNTLRFSLSEPTSSTPGQRSGDTWWRVNTDGNIIGQWTWDGAQWVSVQLRSEVIANLDVSKLSVHDSAQISEAVIGRLFADIFTAHKVTAEQIIVGGLPSEALADGAVGAVKIADGAVLADKLAADSVLADKIKAGEIETPHMKANSINADRLIANSITADKVNATSVGAELITAGTLRTAGTGERLELNSQGVVLYGSDSDEGDYERVRLGPSGNNLLTIGDTAVSGDSISSPRANFGELAVGGKSVSDLLWDLPRGMRAWGELTTDSQLDSDTGNYARRAELQTTLEPNRLYRIALSSHYITTTYGTNTTAVEELRFSYDATPIIEHLNPGSGTYRGVQYRHLITTGNAYASPGIEFMLNTGDWTGERIFWLMWLLRPEHGSAAIRVLARSDYAPVLSIEDMGPSQPSIMKRWNDGNGGGSQDTAPTVVRRTDTWGAGGYGGDVKNGTVYQGSYSSYGNRYGGWIFSSAMRSALSGSTIEKFEAYLENAHWYYGSGGTARIVPNDGSYKGVGFGTTNVESANWPRYAGRWVTIPSSWYPYIASGTYRGLSTYATSTGLTYYGQFKGSPTKFRVTYRK